MNLNTLNYVILLCEDLAPIFFKDPEGNILEVYAEIQNL